LVVGAALSAELLSEAAKFKTDIDRAVNRSTVRFEPPLNATYGTNAFVPCAVVPAGTQPQPYKTMTEVCEQSRCHNVISLYRIIICRRNWGD